MATPFSILVWETPCTEEPGGLQSMRLQSQTWLSNWTHTDTHTLCRHNRSDFVHMHAHWYYRQRQWRKTGVQCNGFKNASMSLLLAGSTLTTVSKGRFVTSESQRQLSTYHPSRAPSHLRVEKWTYPLKLVNKSLLWEEFAHVFIYVHVIPLIYEKLILSVFKWRSGIFYLLKM